MPRHGKRTVSDKPIDPAPAVEEVPVVAEEPIEEPEPIPEPVAEPKETTDAESEGLAEESEIVFESGSVVEVEEPDLPEDVEMVEEPEPDKIVEYFEHIPEPAQPTIKIRVLQTYTNWAIGDGISWLQGSIQEVDLPTFERVRSDNPKCFERV